MYDPLLAEKIATAGRSTMNLILYCQKHAGKSGHNEYGVPLHACNGYRQDEHYWKWLEFKRVKENDRS